MSSALKIQEIPLTESEMGMRFRASALNELDPTHIRQLAIHHRVLALSIENIDNNSFIDFCKNMGDPVSLKDVASGEGFILDLDGDTNREKVVTGRGPLALHNDGFIFGTRVDFLILFGEKVGKTIDSGATIVCDQKMARRELPEELRDILNSREFEYKITERGYFSTTPDDWITIPHYKNYGRGNVLRIGFPFPSDAKASWHVRIKDEDMEVSTKFFEQLEDHFSSPRYIYRHYWRQNEVLIVDNQNTLHGRDALVGSAKRKLKRIQLTI